MPWDSTWNETWDCHIPLLKTYWQGRIAETRLSRDLKLWLKSHIAPFLMCATFFHLDSVATAMTLPQIHNNNLAVHVHPGHQFVMMTTIMTPYIHKAIQYTKLGLIYLFKKTYQHLYFFSSAADIAELIWCQAIRRLSVRLSVKLFFRLNRLPQFPSDRSDIWCECAQQYCLTSRGSRIVIFYLILF